MAIGEVVGRLRIGRRQQIEHGRPELEQAFLRPPAFFPRIGVEIVDESADLGFQGRIACGFAGQQAADDEKGR